MRYHMACAIIAIITTGVPVSQAVVDRSVFVTVLDAHNEPLKNLTAGDFVVMEDRETRDVSSAALTNEPVAVAIMVDTSRPPSGKDLPLRDIRAGLTAFVKAIYAANPQSKVSLMDYSGAAVTTVGLTAEQDKVLKATGRIVTNTATSGVALEGLLDTAKELGKSAMHRRAIVVLSFDAPEMSVNQPRDVANAAKKCGASVWIVTVGSNIAPLRNAVFAHVAPLTGGKLVAIGDSLGLEKILSEIGSALTSPYLVTYKRPEGAPAVSVRVGSGKGDAIFYSPWMQ